MKATWRTSRQVRCTIQSLIMIVQNQEHHRIPLGALCEQVLEVCPQMVALRLQRHPMRRTLLAANDGPSPDTYGFEQTSAIGRQSVDSRRPSAPSFGFGSGSWSSRTPQPPPSPAAVKRPCHSPSLAGNLYKKSCKLSLTTTCLQANGTVDLLPELMVRAQPILMYPMSEVFPAPSLHTRDTGLPPK